MVNKQIAEILETFEAHQLFKIADFLFSEIDESNLQETIDFIVANDIDKKTKFSDLYKMDQCQDVFLVGNQYLITSSMSKVVIIDRVSEDHGVSKKNTRVQFDKDSFIKLITNKAETLNQIEQKKIK